MPEGNPTQTISAGSDPGFPVTATGAEGGGGGERMPRVESMSTEDKPTDEAAEMKRKFKEALDKKNAKHRDGEAHLDGDSPVHGTHGAVQTKREFRRKSG
jgi:hypothetical protein